MTRVLVVVATPGEAERLRDLPARVCVSGIGAVNAALATQDAIRDERPDLVVSAGIAGAYPAGGLQPGDVAVSSEMIYGALGAMDGERFLDLAHLGFSLLPGVHNHLRAWEGAADWAARAHAALQPQGSRALLGPILTLETVTGSAAAARAVQARFPGALAEAMEGAGVAHAAYREGLAALEVRGVSNFVGPRDRAAWRLPQALASLRLALRAVLPDV